MARIAGADLPDSKPVEIALTYIYGVGRPLAQKILGATGISPAKRVRELSEDEIAELRRLIYDGLIAPRGLMPWRAAHPEPVVDVAVDEAPEATVHALRDREREAIRKALQAANNNRRQAAKLLGISERTIYRKIKQYGL